MHTQKRSDSPDDERNFSALLIVSYQNQDSRKERKKTIHLMTSATERQARIAPLALAINERLR